MQNRWLVPFINIGHLLDHLVMLVFPTAVVALAREWGRPYAELLPLALGAFIAFGVSRFPPGGWPITGAATARWSSFSSASVRR